MILNNKVYHKIAIVSLLVAHVFANAAEGAGLDAVVPGTLEPKRSFFQKFTDTAKAHPKTTILSGLGATLGATYWYGLWNFGGIGNKLNLSGIWSSVCGKMSSTPSNMSQFMPDLKTQRNLLLVAVAGTTAAAAGATLGGLQSRSIAKEINEISDGAFDQRNHFIDTCMILQTTLNAIEQNKKADVKSYLDANINDFNSNFPEKALSTTDRQTLFEETFKP